MSGVTLMQPVLFFFNNHITFAICTWPPVVVPERFRFETNKKNLPYSNENIKNNISGQELKNLRNEDASILDAFSVLVGFKTLGNDTECT